MQKIIKKCERKVGQQKHTCLLFKLLFFNVGDWMDLSVSPVGLSTELWLIIFNENKIIEKKVFHLNSTIFFYEMLTSQIKILNISRVENLSFQIWGLRSMHLFNSV